MSLTNGFGNLQLAETLFIAGVYAAGAIGFAGITLIWVRIWQLSFRSGIRELFAADGWPRISLIFLIPLLVWCFVMWFPTAKRVFRCLTESSCGPNLAAGWIDLAYFGLFYFCAEVMLISARFLARKKPVEH